MNYQRILKDCFWDNDLKVEDIKCIANGNNAEQKFYLFEKILLNSTNLFADLSIFKKDELEILLSEYKVPNFNYDFAFRRKNLVEVFFFNKPVLVDDLKWIA